MSPKRRVRAAYGRARAAKPTIFIYLPWVLCLSVCDCVCVCVREGVCVCGSECGGARVSASVREGVRGFLRQLYECVCAGGGECVCVRERVSVCVRE
jgi:hypothetical protein